MCFKGLQSSNTGHAPANSVDYCVRYIEVIEQAKGEVMYCYRKPSCRWMIMDA